MTDRFAGLGRLWSSIWGKADHPHRPALSSSILAALLAVGVVLGFVATRASDRSTNGAFSSTTTTTGPTTTAPPGTTVPPTSPPTTAPTTTAPAAPAAPTMDASSPCTPSDVRVSVSVTTNRDTYQPGSTVKITTAATDVVPCSFTPQPGGQLGCAAFVDVTDAYGDNQVWPGANQSEICSQLGAVDMMPGQQETVTVTWQQAPAGTYRANGFWSWSSGGAQPYQGRASSGFSVT